MATLIPADGSAPRYITPANGRMFTLEELQTIVGGYIEHLDMPWIEKHNNSRLVMFINEDGKRLLLPVNHFATQLMRASLKHDDFIVGNAVVCTVVEAGEDDDDKG